MKLLALSSLLSLGAILASPVFAGPGPKDWPPGFPTHVATAAHAEKCCLPKEKVALACKDCNTVNAKPGTDHKGVAAWFAPGSTHDCSGCGGKITVSTPGGGKAATVAEVKHHCSKCSADSAFTCASHKG